MKKNNESRPPIITVLGHVDHGKTTLLDAIRKTSVAAREAGGITQSIGASTITTKEGKKITFIDTPGHAAFSKMRSRGAKVADIAVLVVSADDGVKPQTQEALMAIREAKIPFVVAITKIDLPSADPEGVKGQLEKEGVVFEGRGGDTPAVLVSAKEQKGLQELVDTIILLSEVHEIKSDKKSKLEAVVIETSKDNRGQLVSVVVRDGTLFVGQEVSDNSTSCKVRALFGSDGKSVKEVFPGEPAQILGFESLPSVGSVITNESAGYNEIKKIVNSVGKIEKGQTPILLKAQNAGALEALLASIPPEFFVVNSSVGDVNESDILGAKASNASVFAFESKISPNVRRLAEAEGVIVEKFDIIYELLERLSEFSKKEEIQTSGKAEILAIFPFNKTKVAGCKAVEGKISKADSFVLKRGDIVFAKAKAISMRRGKQELTEAKAGEEFGVVFDKDIDFKIGDAILATR